jgi:hypothetical protein
MRKKLTSVNVFTLSTSNLMAENLDNKNGLPNIVKNWQSLSRLIRLIFSEMKQRYELFFVDC